MKKLLTLLIFVGLTAMSYGQIIAPKGIYIGRGVTYTGTLVKKVDSLQINTTTKKYTLFNGADSLSPHINVGDVVDGSTLYAPKYILDTLQITDAYTLVLADAGRTIHANKATEVRITVPQNSDVAFPVGTVINVEMVGAGLVHFIKGTNVVFESQKDSVCINTQYGWATLRKRATNKWSLFGAILD